MGLRTISRHSFMILFIKGSYVANPSALRNAKWSDTRAMGYFVDVIRGVPSYWSHLRRRFQIYVVFKLYSKI